jgi:hypothetical protein
VQVYNDRSPRVRQNARGHVSCHTYVTAVLSVEREPHEAEVAW